MALSRRSLLLAALAAAVLAACGPSAALKEARGARYQGTRDEVFLAVIQAMTAEKQVVDRTDPEQAALITRGRWFEKDGTYEDKALEDTAVLAEDGSIFLAFLVHVDGEAPPFRVVVEPSVDQVRSGYSALYHIKPDDAQMPGWVTGKLEKLELGLHKRLKGKLVAAPVATAPAAQ